MRHTLAVAGLALLASVPAHASRCTIGSTTAVCSSNTTTVWTGSWGWTPREVHWQVPEGTPPADGWPTVIVYQGSFMPAEDTFDSTTSQPYGAYWLTVLVDELLDRGYAVLAPEALGGGSTYWQTNIYPYNIYWWSSSDAYFVDDILDGVAYGDFGDLDTDNVFATGLSSGGYMTSRMATNYASDFKALSIHSGSYATCAASVCSVPSLSSSHPPTQLLVGSLDPITPPYTVSAYADELDDAGIDYEHIVYSGIGHRWTSQAVTDIPDWFDLYVD